jgi:LmbE family N-acetylglucosaminyl deacetylase
MTPCILFIFAHPDDESFSGAGTAMQCAAEGVRTVLVTATRGQRGSVGDPPLCTRDELGAVREQELRAAAGIIGFDELHLLDYVDKELPTAPAAELRATLVSIIRRTRPSVVFTFDPNGMNAHVDHIAISRFASDAIASAADERWHPEGGNAHQVSSLLWTPPMTPWEAVQRDHLERDPGVDYLIDVSRWRDRREAALRAHRTQQPSISRCFWNQPDPGRILDREIWRQAWGPPLRRRPADHVLEGL